MKPRTLVESETYQSIETPEGDVFMSVTFNGGSTFCSAIVRADGTVEGRDDDKRSIVADCMDIEFADVDPLEVDQLLREQAGYDRDVALLHEEALAE